MVIARIYPKQIKRGILEKAARILKEGGVIVYPTDTAYGLGGYALDPEIIKRIYKIKGRSLGKPIHVVVPNWTWIETLAYTNESARKIYDKLMPGPITIVLPKKSVVPDILTANLKTIGLRIPNNEIVVRILKMVNFPFTTTSANKSGGETPYSIKEVVQQIDPKEIDLILDAGELPRIKPSTILDLTQEKPKILRKGPISKKEILKVLES